MICAFEGRRVRKSIDHSCYQTPYDPKALTEHLTSLRLNRVWERDGPRASTRTTRQSLRGGQTTRDTRRDDHLLIATNTRPLLPLNPPSTILHPTATGSTPLPSLSLPNSVFPILLRRASFRGVEGPCCGAQLWLLILLGWQPQPPCFQRPSKQCVMLAR